MAVILTCVLMWLGRRVAARAICLSFQIGKILRTFTISPTTSTTGIHHGFERDYNYHTAFRGVFITSSCIRSINSLQAYSSQCKWNCKTLSVCPTKQLPLKEKINYKKAHIIFFQRHYMDSNWLPV